MALEAGGSLGQVLCGLFHPWLGTAGDTELPALTEKATSRRPEPPVTTNSVAGTCTGCRRLSKARRGLSVSKPEPDRRKSTQGPSGKRGEWCRWERRDEKDFLKFGDERRETMTVV